MIIPHGQHVLDASSRSPPHQHESLASLPSQRLIFYYQLIHIFPSVFAVQRIPVQRRLQKNTRPPLFSLFNSPLYYRRCNPTALILGKRNQEIQHCSVNIHMQYKWTSQKYSLISPSTKCTFRHSFNFSLKASSTVLLAPSGKLSAPAKSLPSGLSSTGFGVPGIVQREYPMTGSPGESASTATMTCVSGSAIFCKARAILAGNTASSFRPGYALPQSCCCLKQATLMWPSVGVSASVA